MLAAGCAFEYDDETSGGIRVTPGSGNALVVATGIAVPADEDVFVAVEVDG